MLLDALGFEPVTLDTLAGRSGLCGEAIASMVRILELQGRVAPYSDGRFGRIDSHRLLDSMTTGCVLDVLIYVYDHYMMSDPADVPARRQIFSALARNGFTVGEVVQAMEWLSVLAAGSQGSQGNPLAETYLPRPRAVRVFADGELDRLSDECRTFLTRLDRDGVLTPEQRELVIERTLALDVTEPTLDQLKWVVLLALSVQPAEDAAFARFEALMASERKVVRH